MSGREHVGESLYGVWSWNFVMTGYQGNNRLEEHSGTAER
jgi:hypothetical protein